MLNVTSSLTAVAVIIIIHFTDVYFTEFIYTDLFVHNLGITYSTE